MLKYVWAVVTNRLGHFNEKCIQKALNIQRKCTTINKGKEEAIASKVIHSLIDGTIMQLYDLFSPTKKKKELLDIDVKKVSSKQFVKIRNVLLGSYSGVMCLKHPNFSNEIEKVFKDIINNEQNGVEMFDFVIEHNSLDMSVIGTEVYRYILSILEEEEKLAFPFIYEYGALLGGIIQVAEKEIERTRFEKEIENRKV